jgi:single-strand DNA-binding protein
MILSGVARLGRDIEVRHTASGETVGALALAWSYGRKGEDGNRPTQWIDASLWGERAEKLKSFLLKGQQISVVLEDPHVENYEKKDGTTGASLRARVVSIEFCGSARQQGEGVITTPTTQSPNFDDMEAMIPF